MCIEHAVVNSGRGPAAFRIISLTAACYHEILHRGLALKNTAFSRVGGRLCGCQDRLHSVDLFEHDSIVDGDVKYGLMNMKDCAMACRVR